MERAFSPIEWKDNFLKYCRPKSRLETEQFFSAVMDGEAHIKLYPIEIGRALFAVFSSYQDHGIYQRVYSAIQGLGVEDYYSSLLDNLDRLIKEDPQDFWRTHLFTYAARPLRESDIDAIVRTVLHRPPELRQSFVDILKSSNEPLASKIIHRLVNAQDLS